MNFQITTTVDSKLSYTPCYVQVWLIKVECLIGELKENFKIKNVKVEYIATKTDKYKNTIN